MSSRARSANGFAQPNFALQIMEKKLENYREMLKQALLGSVSCNAIARSRGVSHNTVRRALKLAIGAGLTIEKLDEITDTELRSIVYPGRKNKTHIYPDWEREISYLEKGYNKTEAHARYVGEVGSEAALSRSAFSDGLRKYQKNLAIEYRHNHQPGYVMQIDPAGYRPKGLEYGNDVRYTLFVAILPASSFYFAIVIRSQSTSDIIEATIAAFEFFGGVTETIVSDNLKAVVIGHKPNRDPIINPAYLQFADYYGTRVNPARVYKPKDKGAVESAVRQIQRPLEIELNSRPKLDLNGINNVLRDIVGKLNAKQMARRNESRNQRFDRIDKPYLKPLPSTRMEFIKIPEERRVPPDYHVTYERVKYSVPSELVDKIVLVRASTKKLEIRYDGQVVAIHSRSFNDLDRVTIESHVADNHKKYDTMHFNDWVSNLRPDTRIIVEAAAEIAKVHRHRSKLMSRVRRLMRDFGEEKFNRACTLAIQNGSTALKHVTNLLANGLESGVVPFKPPQPSSKINPVKNVRGPDYYGRSLNKKGGEK